MYKQLIYLLLNIVFYNTYALPTIQCCIDTFESDDCIIKILLDEQNNKWVLKQIKNTDPQEQFLLILDTLGCSMAAACNIPINKIYPVKPEELIAYKLYKNLPATVHSCASGLSTNEKHCKHHALDVQQRFRRPNSIWYQQFGQLSQDETGFTRTTLENMAIHNDLPAIVALDTFTGNSDRSNQNLFYDEYSDSFCGIDMAGIYNKNLCGIAADHISKLESTVITKPVYSALISYYTTLKLLHTTFTPDKTINLLKTIVYEYKNQYPCTFDCSIEKHTQYHSAIIQESYHDTEQLITILEKKLS